MIKKRCIIGGCKKPAPKFWINIGELRLPVCADCAERIAVDIKDRSTPGDVGATPKAAEALLVIQKLKRQKKYAKVKK